MRANRIELEPPRPENLAAKGTASASCSAETAARALDGVYRGDDHAWAPGHVRVGDWFQVDLRKVCAEMPHGRDKIVLDDWGPVVPKGWME